MAEWPAIFAERTAAASVMLAEGGASRYYAGAGRRHAFVGGGQEFGGFTDRGSIPVSRGTLA